MRVRTRLLAVGLISGLLAWPASAKDQPHSDDFQKACQDLSERIQLAYQAAQAGVRELPWEEFDVSARQAVIGEGVDALFAWVRDETRWIGYQGVMRGPQGVLLDRMGSHLDRALLLAVLLESAGHEVRFAHAILSDDEVEALIKIATTNVDADPDDSASADLDVLLEQMAQVLDMEVGELRQQQFNTQLDVQQLTERVVEQGVLQSRSLLGMLAWDEGAPAAAANDGDMRDALRDHWWVQVRRDERWTDLDPSRRSHDPGDRVREVNEPTEVYAVDAIPDPYFHTLRIEIVAEQFAEDMLVENVALTHELRVADMTGQVIGIATEPTELPSLEALIGGDENVHDPAVLSERVLEQDEWMPILNIGGDLVADKSILADGRVNDQPGQMPQGAAMEEAAGALGGIDIGRRDKSKEKAATHLTAVFVRFTISAPGRETEQFERPLVDVLGSAVRAANPEGFELTEAKRKRRAVGLLGSMRVLGQSCWLPESYTAKRSLGEMLQNRQGVEGALFAFSQENAGQIAQAMQKLRPLVSDLLALAHYRQAMSPHREAVVLTRLNVLSYVQQGDWREDGLVGMEGFDIIHNAVEVLPESEVDPRQVRLMQGVLETMLEAELLTEHGEIINTGRAYGEAMAHGERWTLVDDATSLEAVAGDMNEDTRTHLRKALAAGQVVVLPETREADRSMTWWRIDPASGAALGMGPTGRGQAGIEYLTQLLESLDTAYGTASTVMSIWDCLISNMGNAEGAGCCVRRVGVKYMLNKGFGVATIGMHVADKVILGYLIGKGVDAITPDPC